MNQDDLFSTAPQKTRADGFSDVTQSREITQDHIEAAQYLNDSGSQKAALRATLYIFAALTLFTLWLGVDLTYVYFCLTAFVVAGNFPIFLCLLRPKLRHPKTNPPVLPTDCDALDLPFYSILVPVLDEPEMMQQIANSLSNINYPHQRLEIFILIEAHDHATMASAAKVAWDTHIHLISVPPGLPKTKARACNYALNIARGEFIVIFDAEDKPHADQLRMAAAIFATRDASLVCLQAPLKIHLAHNKWLQNQFAIEYRILFSLALQVLGNLNMVMPLGGSSNHFHTESLRKIGGWDAFNLTEDAELSVRLAKNGFRTQMFSPPTIENAPHSLSVWLNQRTRWLTGHIQTWCIHMRHPRDTLRLIGWRNFLGFNAIVLGRLFSGLLHASYLIYLLFAWPDLLSSQTSLMIYWATPVPIILFSVGLIYSPAPTWPHKIWLSLTQPFYWALTSLALLNACWRILTNRLGWLKTSHRPYE